MAEVTCTRGMPHVAKRQPDTGLDCAEGVLSSAQEPVQPIFVHPLNQHARSPGERHTISGYSRKASKPPFVEALYKFIAEERDHAAAYINVPGIH